MKKATQHTRWFCNNITTDVKLIKRFPINTIQPIQRNDEFTEWCRGTGPHSAEAMIKINNHIASKITGKPKSAEQKQRMSEAKLGKKFTKDHRAKLAQAHAGKREVKRLRTVAAFKLAAELGKEYMAREKAASV